MRRFRAKRASDLVREPSLLGNEAGAQNLMERGMTELGLEVDRWRLNAAGLEGMRGFSPPEVSNEPNEPG